MHKHQRNHEASYTQAEINELLDSGFGRLGVVAHHPNTELYEPFSVYGDDIVCDSRVTQDVLRVLALCGFQPNTDKSFMASQSFRESCGKYHWNGHDVTPIYFTVKGWVDRRNASNFASIIEACNQAGDWGYKNLHRTLVRRTLYVPIDGIDQYHGRNPVLFSSKREEGLAIWHHCPSNSHLRKRVYVPYKVPGLKTIRTETLIYGPFPLASMRPARMPSYQAYQRDEVKSIRSKPSGRSSDYSDDVNRYETVAWWRAAWMRDSSLSQDSAPFTTSSNVRLCWGWTPTEA
jgi:hypothetical protein